ncbi:TonB-dependent siderophore receptor [Methylocystis parvus]|uniref:TonB-dependent siderophore receptor n=1 Tax=Methylocystis parvus TaxID=134 RepID=UPI003C763EDC
MFRTSFMRGVSAGALTLAVSTAAFAQQTLPTIDVGGGRGRAKPAVSRGGFGHAGAGPTTAPTASNPGAPAPATSEIDPTKETGYARSTSFGATKTNAKILNTPQNIQIVPKDVIQDRQILSIVEATQNVSGVQAQSGSFYDQYLIRGFQSGYGATYRNSLKMEGIAGSEEVAFTERVEIIKGPASMLYGRIEPGGLVNVVTKRPQEEFKATLEQQAGSWGLARTVADITGAVDPAKTVLVRLMGVYDHADSFTNYDHRDNGAAALFLTFKPTHNFEFNVDFEHYQKKQTQPDGSGTIPVNRIFDENGKPIVLPGVNDRPYNLPRYFSISDPGLWNDFPYVVHRTLYGYNWTYRFDDKWRITNRFHYVDVNENQNGMGNFGGFDGVYLTRNFVMNPLKRSILSTNLDLAGEFATGPLNHKILVGLDWYKYQDDWVGDYGFALPIAPINVFAPHPVGYFTGLLHYLADSARGNTLWRSRWQDFGVYAQDDISFWDDRVHLLVGGRYDKAQEAYPETYGSTFADCFPVCTGYPLKTFKDNTPISPRVGLLFKLDPETSVYGSYVRSSGVNNAALTADGAHIAPEQALQWETGIKRTWFDGKVMTTLALFDLRKKNVLQPDPFNPGLSIAVGEVVSRGVEFDISGQITENLSVIGSYTFDSVKITNDNNNGNVGKWYNGAAPNVGNIWAKWDTAPGLPEGFEFGGGVYAMDKRYGSNDNAWYMPGYVKFDTMAAYRTPIAGHEVVFRFNIKNLTDRRYFERSDNYGFAYYGAPRTFMASANFKW